MCLLFHKWGKWRTYFSVLPERQITKNYVLAKAIEHTQLRTCARCNKQQVRVVLTRVIE